MLKVENLFKNHKFVINDYFIKTFLKYNLNIDDFLVLIYYDNFIDEEFDIKKICEILGISEDRIMKSLNELTNLKLLSINCIKDHNGKMVEVIDLSGFYESIKSDKNIENKEEEIISIFGSFEKGFGRPLSSLEVEIINSWIDNGTSEELINGALNEAVYNGVFNIRYIDKILLEWKKKKYKSMTEVKGHIKKESDPSEQVELFDYDWTSDYED